MFIESPLPPGGVKNMVIAKTLRVRGIFLSQEPARGGGGRNAIELADYNYYSEI